LSRTTVAQGPASARCYLRPVLRPRTSPARLWWSCPSCLAATSIAGLRLDTFLRIDCSGGGCDSCGIRNENGEPLARTIDHPARTAATPRF
jgi:hypothetical protein